MNGEIGKATWRGLDGRLVNRRRARAAAEEPAPQAPADEEQPPDAAPAGDESASS